MPFTRQRPDGTHDALRITKNSPYLSLSTARSFALAAAACGLLSQTASAKSSKAKPLNGVWGWTSGSQTYLRARPSAQTPPVAKVPRHTKLFVWGKFNGWYRVETPDHVFGWVYFDYISAPEAEKLATLSHKKALLASDRTAHQTMYGSKEMLASYYERYKAPGAAKGLKKQGVSLDGTRLVRAVKPKSSPRVASTRLAANTTKTSTNTGIKRIPGTDRPTRDRPFINASDPSFNDVGNVRITPTNPDSDSTPLTVRNTAGAEATVRDNNAVRDTAVRDNAATAEAAKAEAREKQRRIAANAEAARLERLDAERRADAKRQAAANAEAARLAEVQRATAKKQADAVAEAQRIAAAKRKAEAQRIAAAKKPAISAREANHLARLAKQQRERKIREARAIARAQARQRRLASRRNELRTRMGQPIMSAPPAADMRPISPEELMRARDAYLSNQRRSAPRSEGNVAAADGAMFAPSSWTPKAAPISDADLDEATWTEGWDAMPVRTANWDMAAPQMDAPMFVPVIGTADAAAAGAFLPNFPSQPSNNSVTTSRSAQFNAPAPAKAAPRVQPKSFNVGLVAPAARKDAPVRLAAAPARPIAPGGATSAGGNRGGSPRDRFAGMQTDRFGNGLASQALSYRGMPYIRGSASPSRGFDCSGLVYFMLRQRGLKPPRTAAGLAGYGRSVSRSEMKPGDMVFFSNTYKRGISHIGVYIGNNNFVHAATSRSGVRVDSLSSAYYRRKWYGARRAG